MHENVMERSSAEGNLVPCVNREATVEECPAAELPSLHIVVGAREQLRIVVQLVAREDLHERGWHNATVA